MTTDEVLGPDPSDIPRCQKLTRQLNKNIITYEEYAPAMTDRIMFAHSTNMAACFDQIPAEIFPQYAAYLRAYLEPVDFMPSATQWLVNRTEENHQAKRRELRPKYIRLMEVVQQKLESLERS